MPAKSSQREQLLGELSSSAVNLVFYEAPHRVVECVEDLAAGMAKPEVRRLVITRELTKIHESVHECPLDQAAEWLRGHPDSQRGEFVLVLSGMPERSESGQWEGALAALLDELPLAQAVRLTCAITGARRKEVYDRALQTRKPQTE